MNDTTYIALQTIQDYQNATSTVGVKDWINFVFMFINAAILVATIYFISKSPVDAVKTAELLQKNRSDADRKYQNKFYVFASILGLRHALGWNENFVISINQIPIVFHDNQSVLNKLKIFTDKHQNLNGQPADVVLQPLLNDLVVAMAVDLGYKHVDNGLIADYFRPDSSYLRYLADSYRDNEFVANYESTLEKKS
jgi:hypothetical protein